MTKHFNRGTEILLRDEKFKKTKLPHSSGVPKRVFLKFKQPKTGTIVTPDTRQAVPSLSCQV